MTYSEARKEEERILGKVHDFCRGETMVGKGCANCPINQFRVCDDGGNKVIVPISRLREAEKVINEVIHNDQL